jgi:hypothetical protein
MTTAKTSTPAETVDAEVVETTGARPTGLTFAERALLLTSRSEGRDKAVKEALIDEPLIVTRIVFREGGDLNEDGDMFHDFACLDAQLLNDEEVVIVDGGKGIRRQTVQLLAAMGLVRTDDPDEPFQAWDWIHPSAKVGDKTVTFEKTADGRWINHFVKKGLRKSKADDAPASHSYTYFLN